MRQWCSARIPELHVVTSVTDDQLLEFTNRGVLHRFFVACDVAWGVWGGPEPCTTISSRTAKVILDGQHMRQILVNPWWEIVPLWSLILGALLEMAEPGHLQGAMLADVSRQVGGLKYLTGVRVLK